MHKLLSILFMLSVFFLSETIYTAQAFARNIIIVIGVSKTEGNTLNELPFVVNDVKELTKLFQNSKNTLVYILANEDPTKSNEIYATDNIYYMGSPTKSNIEKNLNEILNSVKDDYIDNDTVLVYFSGHGLVSKDDSQKTLLAVSDTYGQVIDSKIKIDESTTISAQSLRKCLKESKIKKKILFLDACHSGGTRGGQSVVDFKDKLKAELAEGNIDEVLTLASCRSNQYSGPKGDVMSLFTYWLCYGLKGYADGYADYDGDGKYDSLDGVTDTFELSNYISNNVKTYMQSQGITEGQDPRQDVVLIGGKKALHFNLPGQKSPIIEELLQDFAEQIATHALANNISSLNYNDFKSEFLAKSNVGNQNALKENEEYCTDRLEKEIGTKLGGYEQKIRITKNVNVLKNDNNTIDENKNSKEQIENKKIIDLQNEIVYFNSSKKSKGYYLLKSTLHFSDGSDPLIIQGKVSKIKTDVITDTEVTEPSSSNDLTEPEPRADEGSVKTDESNNIPIKQDIPEINLQVGNVKLPGVYIEVKTPNGVFERRNFVQIGDALYIPFNVGEVYRIVFECNGISQVGLRLLVDSKNTLAQEEPVILKKIEFVESSNISKYQAVAGVNNSEPNEEGSADHPQTSLATSPGLENKTESKVEHHSQGVVAPVVRLNYARFWVIKDLGQPLAIEGFYKKINENVGTTSYNEFTVVDASDEVVPPGEYTSKMGIITIGFYNLVKSIITRGEGIQRTVPGRLHTNVVQVVDGLECGDPIKIIKIRYASSNAINAFLNKQSVPSGQENNNTMEIY